MDAEQEIERILKLHIYRYSSPNIITHELKAESQPSDQFQWRWRGIVKLTGLRHRNRPRAGQRVDVLPCDRDPRPFSSGSPLESSRRVQP
jgi:hypothetical protein